jgi:Molecular chaperone (small heat shock protein)
VLPTDTDSSWLSRTGTPSRLFGAGSDDYELFEEDGEFVLSVEMPGFDPDEIEVGWHKGRLTIAAEQHDERRGRSRTYRRSFRMPKEIDEKTSGPDTRTGCLMYTFHRSRKERSKEAPSRLRVSLGYAVPNR